MSIVDLPLVTPVGRLKDHISFWKAIGSNDFITDLIVSGYKIPFQRMPVESTLPNNKSARESENFVSDEIQELKVRGCIRQCATKPHVINPLTVATGHAGKKRLVLDCRHINPLIVKHSCRFEDI